MSPIHLRYLANVGVQTSMSFSIIVNQKLWGLIACHQYGSLARVRIKLPLRKVCKSLGNIASSNVEKLLYSSRIAARMPLSKAPPKGSPQHVRSRFGFLVIRGEVRTIGRLLAYTECVALLKYIRHRAFATIFYAHSIEKDCPDFNHSPKLKLLSGMLVVPLTLSGTDFLVFLRKSQLKEINWADNPYEKLVGTGNSYLGPRSSFKRWSENVAGTSGE
jgi:light-regulated signal transduction histidine kinase (bacteriophytochrome)